MVFINQITFLMKKITLLAILLLGFVGGEMKAQCINTNQTFPPVVSAANSGLVETVSTSTNTSNYVKIENLIVGSDYIFTCALASSNTHKYITVTDLENNVVTFGQSPLTVNEVPATSLRLHYTDNANCGNSFINHLATLQIVIPCPVPLDLSPTLITQTTADVTWQPVGDETSWEVLIIENGDPLPTSATVGIAVNDNSEYTFTDLNDATTYNFYVRANCGDGFSPWNGSSNFVTLCDPTNSFNEAFDTTENDKLPTCWSKVTTGIGVSQYAEVETVSFNSFSGEKALMINNSDSEPTANIILVSPLLNNLSEASHRIKLYARSYNTASIEVGTLDSADENAIFSSLVEVSITSNYAEYVIDFTGYSGTDTYIGIRHNSSTPYTSIFLDDIRWEISPLCPDVTEINVTATTSSASLNWTSNGNETEWEIVYGNENVTDPTILTPLTPSVTSSPETVIPGLTDNTNYKVWVRSVCGDNDGAWIGPIKFKTLCLPTSSVYEGFENGEEYNLPDCWTSILSGEDLSEYAAVQTNDWNAFSGEKAAILYNSTSGEDNDIILVSPNLSTLTTATHRIKFHAKSSNPSSLQIGTLSSSTDAESFTPFQTIAITAIYDEYVIDFTSYTGSDTFIAFRHNSLENHVSIFLDDIVWEPSPICADVSGITLNATTPSSASLSWDINGGETQWDVVYGNEAIVNPNILTPITPASTEPNILITGLTENTNYKVWLRSVCGADPGAWIGPKYIVTACIPDDSFFENFDSTQEEDLPNCWSSIINGEDVSQFANVRSVSWNIFSGTKAVQIYNDNSGEDANIILVSPNLGTLANGTHQLKFYADSFEGASIQVGTLDGNSIDANFTSFQEVAITEDYAEYTIDFSNYSGTDTYIGLRHNSGENVSIFIDDIRWEEGIIDCQPLTAFNEDFDDLSIPNLPNCWSKIIRGETVSPIDIIETKSVTIESAPNSINFFKGFSGNSITDELILVSPELSNLSAGTHQLAFSIAGNATNIEIGTLNSNSDAAVFTVFQTITTDSSTETQQYTIDFSTYTGTNTFIGIRLNAGTTQFVSVYLDNIIWSPALSGNDFDNQNFKYYPNPVKDILNLSYAQNISNVTIFNLLGQKISDYKIDSNSTQVNMSALSQGTYIVKVIADNKTKTFKVIKD